MPKKRFFKKYKRQDKTDYNKRLDLLKSGLTRLVVRISSKNIIAQLVDYEPSGDKVVAAVSTKNIEKLGWKASRTNLSAAYLLGYLLAAKSKGKVKKAIFDIGKRRSLLHSRVYAVVKGAIDGGIEIPVQEDIFPSEERIQGNHIKAYAENLAKEDKPRYEKLFSLYLKNNLKPETLPEHFQEIKSKIKGAN
ncbi:MAG: 50S ribosomal protein L18 [Candidatus Woesearchaeota archaeon]